MAQRRVKISREQWAYWRQSGKSYLVEKDTGLIFDEVKQVNDTWYICDKDGEPTQTTANSFLDHYSILDARNAVRYQIRTVNDNQDAVILALNGTVIGTTRARGQNAPSSGVSGVVPGAPIPPEQCDCRSYSGTPKGSHHPVCLHRTQWEQRAQQSNMNAVVAHQNHAAKAHVQNYPLVNTQPPKPRAAASQRGSVLQNLPAVNNPSVTAQKTLAEAKTTPETPGAKVGTNLELVFTDNDFDVDQPA